MFMVTFRCRVAARLVGGWQNSSRHFNGVVRAYDKYLRSQVRQRRSRHIM